VNNETGYCHCANGSAAKSISICVTGIIRDQNETLHLRNVQFLIDRIRSVLQAIAKKEVKTHEKQIEQTKKMMTICATNSTTKTYMIELLDSF
jgi:hypothetical protein